MDTAFTKENIRNHFERTAKHYKKWKKKNSYYYSTIKNLVKSIVRPGSNVLEVGCATGEILDSVSPKCGVGIDISANMIDLARRQFPQHTFINTSIEEFTSEEKFDYIVMVDVIDHVYDVIDVLKSIRNFCKPDTKVIITTINPWWEPVLMAAEKLGLKMPEGPHNFIERRNLTKIVESLDFTVAYCGYALLLPKYIPLLSFLANAIGTRIWGINKFSFVHYMVVNPLEKNKTDLGLGCSVVIPCYNEAANIKDAICRIPAMGKETEIIVVNDGSIDKTVAIVEQLKQDHPNLRLIDYSSNKGKGYAVKQGFDAASQEVLMILDADISTLPEELPRFFNLLNSGKCDFVNGTRMIYPMQNKAMRFLNLLGNKFFSFLMTFIVGQQLTDTLCGTKALYKKDYQYITMGRDKWGDFDLLFGAAKLGCRIMEVPVHYKNRTQGESKMKAFRHALLLLCVCWKGFYELILSKRG